ncbi:MAG: lactate racemase domain-containing protein [Bacteroidetes bacterium]|nr:lactate racemase domain-containing protein [Bacteroidota bacterium]
MEHASQERLLTETDIARILGQGLRNRFAHSDRVLVIIPDATRTAPIPLIFRLICDLLLERVAALDFLVALGTHAPMSESALLAHVGISRIERVGKYSRVGLFNHVWDDPSALVTLKTIPAEEVFAITHGLIKQKLPVTVNHKVLNYDAALVCGPVFPHEVAGFSGGNKYFFPGISGPEVIDFTHWVGALMTSRAIIGTYDTPVRRLIDRAAREIPCARYFVNMVVDGSGLAGVYVGSEGDGSWLRAARHSAQLHITWLDTPVSQAFAVVPSMYDDLWTGAKGMYKLEPVIADGGEILLYAPHISELSYTHGKLLDEIGFHGTEYFNANWDSYGRYPWAILAHAAHVRGVTTYERGVEVPRIRLTLASQIPRERCEKVGLGYRDPRSIDLSYWKKHTEEGYLYVPSAGEHLYKLRASGVGPAAER